MSKNPEKQEAEIEALARLDEAAIDTSDAPDSFPKAVNFNSCSFP